MVYATQVCLAASKSASAAYCLLQSCDSAFDDDNWERMCNRLGSAVDRPPRATDPNEPTWKETFSDVLFDDNWFHVRKLFLALKEILNNPSGSSVLERKEEELLKVLAAVRAGAHDPLPWVLCGEYLLRDLWRKLLLIKSGAQRMSGKWNQVHCKLHFDIL